MSTPEIDHAPTIGIIPSMNVAEMDENWFGQLLSVLQTEELMRIRVRLKKKGFHRLAEVLAAEIDEREELDKSQIGY